MPRSLRVLLVCGATLLPSGCSGASIGWTKAWTQAWSLPPGERTCTAEELVEDGTGGAFLQTTTPISGSTAGPARYRVAADGTTTPLRPRDLPADRLTAESDPARAVAITGLGDESAAIAVHDRHDASLRWDIAFDHVVTIFDIAFVADRLWVAGTFRDALRVADRTLPVGPPHPGRIITPRFGVQVPLTSPTITPDRVQDGFLLRFGPKGDLELLKHLHSGMVFLPGAIAPAENGVHLLASLTGAIPQDIRHAAATPLPHTDHTALTLLLSINDHGTVEHAHPLNGPTYGHRLATVHGGLLVFLGQEHRRCELFKWTPGP